MRFKSFLLITLLLITSVLTGQSAYWEHMNSSFGKTYITDIWGVSQDLLYATGSEGEIGIWNGSSWTQVRSVSNYEIEHLNAIHGFSETDIWAVGEKSYDTLFLH